MPHRTAAKARLFALRETINPILSFRVLSYAAPPAFAIFNRWSSLQQSLQAHYSSTLATYLDDHAYLATLDAEPSSHTKPCPPPKRDYDPIRRYNPSLFQVEVNGQTWDQRSLLLAYLSIDPHTRRAHLSNSETSGGTLGRGAGVWLSEVLTQLQMDEDLFESLIAVLATSSVREALSLINAQTSPASMSPDGQPLWPPWLLRMVVERTENATDVHLSIAAIVHHLPYLPRLNQAWFLRRSVELSVKFRMEATLPSLVHIVLAAAPQLSLSLPQAKHRSKAHTDLILALAPSYSDTLFDSSPIILHQLVRVLDDMEAHGLRLSPKAVDALYQLKYMVHPKIQHVLLRSWDDRTVPRKLYHAKLWMQLGWRERDRTKVERWMAQIDALTPTHPRTVPSPFGTFKKFFGPESVASLETLRDDPELAFDYFDSFDPPPPIEHDAHPSTPAEDQARYFTSDAWSTLIAIMASSNPSLQSLERALSDPRSTTDKRTLITTINTSLNALRFNGHHAFIFTVWDEWIVRKGVIPTSMTLNLFTLACRKTDRLGYALREIDRWAVRHGGVHEILPVNDDGQTANPFHLGLTKPGEYSFARSQVLVRDQTGTETDAADPAVLRIQLDGLVVRRLMDSLSISSNSSSKHLELILRIWHASEMRWGVTQTDEMLRSVLMAAAHSFWNEDGTEAVGMSEDERVRSGLVLNASFDGGEERGTVDHVDHVDWVSDPVEAFLVPPSREERAPHLRAKELFETVLFSNWPLMKRVKHPSVELDDPPARPPSFGPFFFSSSPPVLSSVDTLFPLVPSPSIYSHLHPTASSFNAYYYLLARHSFFDEIPMAFAYMKHLALVPEERTLVDGLARLAAWAEKGMRSRGERFGPEDVRFASGGDTRWSVGTRPDRELWTWLKAWLGTDGLPSDEAIRERWRQVRTFEEFTIGSGGPAGSVESSVFAHRERLPHLDASLEEEGPHVP